MANLATYQKITRVIPGKPFGNGTDGALSSATIPTMVNESCSGSATSTALTCSSTSLSNGNIILIHQSRGTGVGQWEINKVSSGGGSTNIVLTTALQFTYTDSGASQAQATVIKQYTDVTVQSGTWNVPAWDANENGILVFACNGTFTPTGSINGIGKGYDGGARAGDPGTPASGEGGSGDPGSQATGAGQGAGAGQIGYGGGYGVAGTGASGGSAYGSADLTTISFGGAGSGASANPITNASDGADSGGMIMIIAKTVASPTGTISVSGDPSAAATDRSGGGGSGGAILVVCETATLGTNKLLSAGGAVGAASSQGTVGGAGRIAVHHSGTVTGTTNPTFDDTTDTSLVESGGGAFFALL